VAKDEGPRRSLFDDIRRIALLNVENSDWEAVERRERRRFSERFHTPLPEVDALDLGYVLLNLYEADFGDMPPGDRARAAAILTRTEAEEELEQTEAERDEADMQRLLEQVKAEEDARAAKRAASSLGRAADSLEALARSLPDKVSVDFPATPGKKE